MTDDKDSKDKPADDSTTEEAAPSIPPELATDRDVLDALKAATLAELGKRKAEADAGSDKAGRPEAPSLDEIKPPSDREVKVGDGAGKATAALASARSLKAVGFAIGSRVAAAITGIELPPTRSRLPAIVEYYQGSNPTTDQARLDQLEREAQAKRDGAASVYVIDSPSLALATLSAVEIRERLEAYRTTFVANTPLVTLTDDIVGRIASGFGQEDEQVRMAAANQFVAAMAVPALGALTLAVNTAGALAKFGVELVGALQSRYAIHAQAVSLDRTALVAAVIDRLLDAPITVRWPRFERIETSSLLDLVMEATIARDQFAIAHRVRTTPPPTPPPPTGGTLAKDNGTKDAPGDGTPDNGNGTQNPPADTESLTKRPSPPQKPPETPPVDPITATGGDLVTGFDAYIQAITKVDSEGVSPLVEAALIEAALPSDPKKKFLLFLGITAQGADGMTGQGLVRGSTAAFVGFAQAYFVVTRPDGSVLTAGTSTKYNSIKLGLNDGRVAFGDTEY